ncbi:Probable inactive purple acid phosphatase 27 [Striga hermonthica]|uniref:Probable inactive purple acid phosphatase 27 n=1 Tax=Striga hermonthica TaxID=68872 RepID=A0A9N7NJT1_STRHE|nr:Probable inactive purple acid phosphatase 27 [Striga hermonthica]
MTGLRPSTSYSYVYGSDLVGWSENITFKTPPFAGANELKFIAYGDMGKAPLDSSMEHFMQSGSLRVVKAMADDMSSGLVDSIFHIGDISYATGFLVEWDYFLSLISTRLASRVPYMTSIGNHERNYMESASLYKTTDSGGECGVPYETYFPMPTPGKDMPWYFIEQGPVHFTVISTEHNWSVNSEQYEWMRKDMAAVDRTTTPWIIFTGHRPMNTTNQRYTGLHNVDHMFIDAIEPLLLQNKVDLVLFGHIYNYERTCAVYQKMCLSMPTKEGNGIDTYDNTNYTAPVHAIIGMAGFTIEEFPTDRNNNWSLSRIAQFGYIRAHASRNELKVEEKKGGQGFGLGKEPCLIKRGWVETCQKEVSSQRSRVRDKRWASGGRKSRRRGTNMRRWFNVGGFSLVNFGGTNG